QTLHSSEYRWKVARLGAYLLTTYMGAVKAYDTAVLQDQPLAPMLYDADKPSNAILVDVLPMNFGRRCPP
ncbi:MAG: hypothetical protein WKG03_14330, partial [Telluria sp.]